MKYLLPCPACGTKTPVATGQAGQMLQCSCGKQFEIPPIRKLRDLEPAEDEPLAPLWTKRQGLLFLGSLITVCSAAFAAVLWLNLPAQFIPPTINIDQSAVDKEVAELSPAESLRRFVLIQSHSPGSFEQRLQSKEVPPFLMVSAQPLLEFERRGPGPLAPKQMAIVRKETHKYVAQMIANASIRNNLRQWLWIAGGIFVGGVLIACSSLLVRSGKSANQRRRARQVA